MGGVLAIITVPIAFGIGIIVSRSTDFIALLKWIIAFVYIEISRRMNKRLFDLYDMQVDNQPEKIGFLPPKIEYDLESPAPVSHLLRARDEIFFYGVNAYSDHFITRIARTVNNEAQAWIFLKLKNGKVYNLNQTLGYEHACSDTEREFSCGGLRMHYMKPMRRWRIFYHGLLRETSEKDPSIDRMVYVKFAFIWRATSDCFHMATDINSAALASAFARSEWGSFTPPLKKLMGIMNIYCQSGVVTGTVHVDGETEDHNLYLFGERIRLLGDTFLDKGNDYTRSSIHVLGQISKTGCIFHLVATTIETVVTNLKFGFVVLPDGVITPITDRNMVFEHVSSGQNESIKAIFHADGRRFEVEGIVVGKQDNFESKKGWDGMIRACEIDIQMNSLVGSGVLMHGRVLKPSRRNTLLPTLKQDPKKVPSAVHFSKDLCAVSDVTGGKGSSLGKLTQLSKEFRTFIVPNGIVVTTSAYMAFVNKEVLREITCLEDVLYGRTSGEVKEACQRVMDEVMKSKIPDSVQQEIIKCLQETFGESLLSAKFAVRSSATGEDTEQLSAAGQMDTILGVTGLNEIMSALKKCWASQFGFVAVNYKRQYGQIINSPMAVVIQEMVPCDVAGVLFTCDPLTGNPTLMSITANYGLGESVVSASEEPDTITLERDVEGNLKIKEKIIGSKGHRIVIKEDEGTKVEEVSEDEKKACCLSDDMTMRLANIAVQIEEKYRSNRDIEWGFWNNNLYIFQSRPVTSGTEETDFEIDHEIDAPLRNEKDYFTICNVGEVMPGATSPLGLDIFSKIFHTMFQRPTVVEWQSDVRGNYFPKFLLNLYYHEMFGTVDFLERVNEGKAVIEATMVGFFGRVIDDEELYEVARLRYVKTKKKSALKKYYRLYKSIFASESRLNRAKKAQADYRVPVEKMKNSHELFDTLVHLCTDINEAITCHLMASQASSMWNLFMITTLGKAKGGLNSEVYSDFAQLLSSIDDVESADVPSAMQSLAYHIGKELSPEQFKKMDCEEIVQWLNNSSSEAGVRFRQFLKKHGHRCLREFDVRSITWGMDPKILIQLVKNFGNVSESKSEKTSSKSDQLLSSYSRSMGFTSRMMVNFLLPRCRSGVQCRERTKSFMIRMIGEWRKGYRHLAKMMVAEGRIPDEDLMYFMPLEEIKELLSNRSPRIIAKAFRRKKRYPILDSYLFPEYMKGFPIPLNLDTKPFEPTAGSFSMKGIPVSQGVAKGFIRVALNLEEASHLKPGEILMTYCTDIGWTPYFPALAGVVTELGGLISHGAVVSREYGLPCIAGLHGATQKFQTGDYVILDGNTGVLQKIPPPE